MKGAFGKRAEIASIVNQRRLPAAAVLDDVRQLVTLSLHCRAAVAALAPTVDRRAADALANKVLVVCEKRRCDTWPALAPPSPREQDPSLGAALSKDVNALLHKTAQEWGTGSHSSQLT